MRIIDCEMSEDREFFLQDGSKVPVEEYSFVEEDDVQGLVNTIEELTRADVASEGKLEVVLLDLDDYMIPALVRK